jgi:uncharacterized membrane protein
VTREQPGEPPGSPWLLLLCYTGPLGFIPLLWSRSSRAIRWHAKNGLLLFAALILVGGAATLLGIAVPRLTCAYGVAMLIAGVVYVVVVVLAVVKALEGQRLYVAGISRYADRF